MRSIAAVTCGALLVLLLAGGCASFPGEWVEVGTLSPDGSVQPVEGERRAALQFIWPSTVRYGAYDNLAKVVDHEVVQQDTYLTSGRQGRAVRRAQGKGERRHARRLPRRHDDHSLQAREGRLDLPADCRHPGLGEERAPGAADQPVGGARRARLRVERRRRAGCGIEFDI
jgi:hypothetical protein